MNLQERINEYMKTAMRAKAADKLGTIRLLLAAIRHKEVDERITLDGTAADAIVDKLIKHRKDSISQFQAAGRTDLDDQEAAEPEVLIVFYMPQQLSADEVAQAVKVAVTQTGAAGPVGYGSGDGRAQRLTVGACRHKCRPK